MVVSYTAAKGSIPFTDRFVFIYLYIYILRWPYRLMAKTQRLQCCYTGSKPVKAIKLLLFFINSIIIKVSYIFLS